MLLAAKPAGLEHLDCLVSLVEVPGDLVAHVSDTAMKEIVFDHPVIGLLISRTLSGFIVDHNAAALSSPVQQCVV
jgi:hypothetical protein